MKSISWNNGYLRYWIQLLTVLLCIQSSQNLALATDQHYFGQIKYKLDDLSKRQRLQLLETIDAYARFDAVLSICGFEKGLKQRLRSAIGKCTDEQSLKYIISRFSSVRSKKLSDYKKNGFPCNLPDSVSLISDLDNMISRGERKLRWQCRLCIWC